MCCGGEVGRGKKGRERASGFSLVYFGHLGPQRVVRNEAPRIDHMELEFYCVEFTCHFPPISDYYWVEYGLLMGES